MNRSGYYFYQVSMLTYKRCVILFMLFIAASTASAQGSDAATRLYHKALSLRLKHNDSGAYKEIEKAIATAPGYTDAYSTLGAWYFYDRKYAAATDVFVKASRSCRNGQRDFALPLARTLLHNNKPQQAMQLIVGNRKPDSEWEQLYKQALFMQKALAHPLPDTVYNLGVRVNTRYAEMYPFISADTQQLYYSRMVNNIDLDCYMTIADTCGGWHSGGNLGSPTNTMSHEAAQTVSADGHYLFYMRCDNRSDNGWDQGGCDLYMSYTADTAWTVGQSFGATINTPAFEGMPCLSPDNRDLYYVSNREGGYGGFDIWVSRFEDGLWQQPRNLGPEINTPGDETAPFIHIDNRTLYFSSTGHTGMGGADLYYCRRTGDTTWSAPKNLGYPINTSANEVSMSVTMDGNKAFLSSDRDSVTGNYDLYETKLASSVQPIPVAVINGHAYDSLEKTLLNYTVIQIYDPYTEERLYRYVTNRGDGSFMMTLPLGKNYKYIASRVGYMEREGEISLTDYPKDSANVLEVNIPLLPNGYSAPIHDSLILTLHFPINSYEITDADKAAIQQAMEPWLQETGLVIFVSGYTDNTGTPMLNEQLSTTRAQLVADELISYGINEINIVIQGWGEAAPLAPNDTEEGRDMNRRVEVVIRR